MYISTVVSRVSTYLVISYIKFGSCLKIKVMSTVKKC